MSDPQFTVKPFARGVKLTVQHVWVPAGDMWSGAASSAIDGQERNAKFTQSWTFTPDSETYGADPDGLSEFQRAHVTLPMLLPPPQQVFDSDARQYVNAPQLTGLSFGFDTRGEAGGVVDQWYAWPPQYGVAGDPNTLKPVWPAQGLLTQVDLSRYDTTMKLVQKVPTVLGGDASFQTVLTLEIPGTAIVGAYQNPYVIDGLSVFLNPYGAYYWVMETPGLAKPLGDQVIQESAIRLAGIPFGGGFKTYEAVIDPVFWAPGCTLTLTPSSGGGPYNYTTQGFGSSEYIDALQYFVVQGQTNTVWEFFLSSSGPPRLICRHRNPGANFDTIAAASSAPGTATFTATNTVVGSALNKCGVFDGTHTYQYSILTGDTLADCAAGLAAVINGNDGYTAVAQGEAIRVSNQPGVPFSFTDAHDSTGSAMDIVYAWYSLAAPSLAMPNLTLAAQLAMPLMHRDYAYSQFFNPAKPYVQNIPLKHLGQPQTKSPTFPVAQPAADAIITGTDWQDVVTTLEQPLLDGLRSGYGRDPGTEGDVFPWEQMAKDAGYQVINVQLWDWWDVRRRTVDPTTTLIQGAGFPYYDGLPDGPLVDQRVIRVPEGFVVHYVLACQNSFPYPKNRVFSQGSNWGLPFAGKTKVGVALYSGVRADDQKFQQVAYLEFTSRNTTYLIDELKLDGQHVNMRVYACPLVWGDGVLPYGTGYNAAAVKNGQPFWMGAGNSTTAARTATYNMPANFGGVAPSIDPATKGGENALVVRWSMEDAGGIAAANDQVLAGPGGHQVILIGKQSVVGSDTDAKPVSSNPAVGTW